MLYNKINYCIQNVYIYIYYKYMSHKLLYIKVYKYIYTSSNIICLI